ncbi:hypothetical protein MRX96_037237 [Rhipicephalus microplus]
MQDVRKECFVSSHSLSQAIPTEGNKVTVICALVTDGITSGVEFLWYKDGKALALDDRVKIRSFPDMSTLVIGSLRQEDSGNYTCTGRLGGRKDSHTEQLRVLGVLLTPSGSKLQLHKATKADSGTYKCTADNGLREPLAKEVRVSVYEFKLQPFRFPSDAVEGKTVTVLCTTTTAISGVQYRWLKDGKHVSESSKIRLRTFPELSSLIVGPLQESDSGNYTCHGVYNDKKGSFSDVLNVRVPPSWTETPDDTVRVMEGTNLTVSCRAKGKPKPTVIVIREGTNEAQPPSIIHINKATRQDSGYYTCKADNAVAQPLVKRFRVVVYGERRHRFAH